MNIKIWVDDIRPAPPAYEWCRSTNEAIATITQMLNWGHNIIEVNLDHDAGDFVAEGGDYIQIMNWMEELENEYLIPITWTFKFHTMNPVGRQNMITICERNNWHYDN